MKGKSTVILIIVAFFIAFAWDKVSLIKNTAHYLLNPTLGALITWNALIGLLIIVLLLNIVVTLIHKYTTDQEALKELKEQSKEIQSKMKEAQKNQDNEKIAELSKQSLSQIGEQTKHSFASMAYTFIPMILFFRWFGDFFEALGNPKVFIGFGWLGTYLIFSIIFSVIIRKVLKVH